MKILVTGASGFVGRYLLNEIAQSHEVIAYVRKKSNLLPSSVQQIVGNNFFDIAIPKDTDVIVHLAGIAHNKNKSVEEFKKINVDGTLELAHKALQANVKRFIFMSSIGVNGNSTDGKAFTEQDTPNPINDYTISKYQAEVALEELFKDTKTDLVIIRPPLIYAHDAPGNFSKLLMLIKLGQFLPFGCTQNQRSFISIENLISFITACIYHDTKINETFLIADDEVISTKQLIQCVSSGMGKSMILLPVPTELLSILADVTGKVGIFEQLYGNLQIDNRKAKKFFNWHPPKHSLNALKEVGNLYRNNEK
ncbi:NAD-dependent epimerase/dehydratase family protein [Moraxellaceae bacterium 17A]|nr:NAD-dependent epimerase/dehydratase family protein [Moraxellaceae bacterium 17A]